MNYPIDKFGRWTVLNRGGDDRKWLVRCECGKTVRRHSDNLTSGKSKGCHACSRMDMIVVGNPANRHMPTIRSWISMTKRCTYAGDKSFHRYGAVGITVCDRWKCYDNFVLDMGIRPDGTTLDRKDGAGNYNPSNCRWATSVEQGRNKRTNKPVTINGESLLVPEWAERSGLKIVTIRARMRSGWPSTRLLEPARKP